MKERRKTGNLIPCVFGSCLGLGVVGTGDSSGSRGGPRCRPAQTRPSHGGRRVGAGGAADRSALPARCFSVNFYGMQKEVFVLFCFFVKLKKKNLHLILEPPYLKKKRKKINKKETGTQLALAFCVPSRRPHFLSACGCALAPSGDVCGPCSQQQRSVRSPAPLP